MDGRTIELTGDKKMRPWDIYPLLKLRRIDNNDAIIAMLVSLHKEVEVTPPHILYWYIQRMRDDSRVCFPIGDADTEMQSAIFQYCVTVVMRDDGTYMIFVTDGLQKTIQMCRLSTEIDTIFIGLAVSTISTGDISFGALIVGKNERQILFVASGDVEQALTEVRSVIGFDGYELVPVQDASTLLSAMKRIDNDDTDAIEYSRKLVDAFERERSELASLGSQALKQYSTQLVQSISLAYDRAMPLTVYVDRERKFVFVVAASRDDFDVFIIANGLTYSYHRAEPNYYMLPIDDLLVIRDAFDEIVDGDIISFYRTPPVYSEKFVVREKVGKGFQVCAEDKSTRNTRLLLQKISVDPSPLYCVDTELSHEVLQKVLPHARFEMLSSRLLRGLVD